MVGLTLANAQTKLAALGLSETHTGAGDIVAAQMPAAGASVASSSTVTLAMTAPVPPPNQPLFTLTFNKPISKGGFVWFTAPTAIPSGSKLQVYPPGSSGLVESPFEPVAPVAESQSEPASPAATYAQPYQPTPARRGLFRRR